MAKTKISLLLILATYVVSAAASDSIWSIDNSYLYRIDPHSGKILEKIEHQLKDAPLGIACDNGDLWCMDTHYLYKMDFSGKILAKFDHRSKYVPTAMAFGDGKLWIADSRYIYESNVKGEALGKVRHDLNNAPQSLSYANGYLWSIDNRFIYKIDSRNGQTSKKVEHQLKSSCEGTAYAKDYFLWAIDRQHLYKIDPITGKTMEKVSHHIKNVSGGICLSSQAIATIDTLIIVGYFVFILLFGSIFGRYTRTTKDFFFGGQKFSWWLIAMSCVATVVGSYSFIKYSAAAYSYGFSSSMTYLNDWFIVPLFIFGWLPIIYFSRVNSIPEYFERRFDRPTRAAATVFVMLYLIGYIGINLYTLGTAMEALFGIDIYQAVIIIAAVCAIYVTAGGQTAVIMTDLLQGFVLLIAGFVLFALGLSFFGGIHDFWGHLPAGHRLPFSGFNKPSAFPGCGIFWQDAFCSTMAFYFMNQGIIMRFLSVKSAREGRKAIVVVILVLMPLAMLATGNAGWLGKAMEEKGSEIGQVVDTQKQTPELSKQERQAYEFSEKIDAQNHSAPKKTPKKIFVWVSQVLCIPGMFGFIIAALMAALMSTVDTLINAVSAVFVNDIWRPYIKPDMPDKHYLFTARWFSVAATILGVLLVPIYVMQGSIYAAHGMFTAAVTPPMVVAIMFGAFWRRYTPRAAFLTLIGGGFAIAMSFVFPRQVLGFEIAGVPVFSFGVSEEGYKFIRAFYGLAASAAIGIVATYLTRPASDKQLVGTVIGTLREAMRRYKGAEPKFIRGKKVCAKLQADESIELGTICLAQEDLEKMKAEPGDILYVCDRRWWFGGVKSNHAKVAKTFLEQSGEARLHPQNIEEGSLETSDSVVIELII